MKGLRLDAGVNVTIGKRPATIVRVLDLDSYLIRFENEEHRVVGRKDIDDPRSVSAPIRALDDYTPAETSEAYRWWEVLKPLLIGTVSRGEKSNFMIAAGKTLGVDRATVYRRVTGYNGTVMSLLPKGGQGGRGRRRMSTDRNALLEAVIQKYYLVRNQPAPMTVYKEHVEVEFGQAGLRPPALSTFYDRIAELDEIDVIEARQGKRAAHDARKRLMGSYPFADAPLSSVQIDYWDYDLEVVDSVDRLPIGRPRLTMVIDTFSFIPVGYYLSLDPTGASSAGLAIFHSITRKERWLADLGVDMEWPVWGFPKMIHADNAKEFRGSMLRQFMANVDGELMNRKVKTPRYGPHIERYFGKLAFSVKHLPGATGSNIRERAKLPDPRKTASLTLDELERYLLSIIKEHINTKHSKLGMTPLEKWRSHFFEGSKQINKLPDEVDNLDFWRKELMPKTERTLQTYGVQWDLIHYDSDALVALRQRHAKSPQKTFIIRRDPRDISEVYVWDPDNKVYLTVRYRSPMGVGMTIWDQRATKRALEEKGLLHIGENEIFDAFKERTQRQELVASSKKDTLKARRQREQKRRHEHARKRETSVLAGSRALAPLPKLVPVPQPVETPQPDNPPSPRRTDTFDDLDI
ncbi:MAG: Mu transposase C-terminal domain-containing protein [Brevundimonas sp.]|nr:Mu transposase C-terminal domain-containing protein [Brevundimonas sp.]